MKQKITARKMTNKDELAQVIATLGLVTRQGAGFVVRTPTLHGRTLDFEVWRDETGKIHCSCLENDDREGLLNRCEHILAVKHALTMELSAEQPINEKSGIADDSKEAELDLAAGQTDMAESREEGPVKPPPAPTAQPLLFSSSFRGLNVEESS